ncbi:GNAT family N-acetyltransferase [Oricola cellulosilytica]|uniref:GNAT family N-acetyltransferase n=1 Tax=Oricola cellulosilytica TaxID=1429082 RepID=A0A4R0PEC7_9HYPH|nr:GNAT family N-acetyltransferase [Oricola cellulosilytica]TCD13723.1 GNAT family N-acetyltransferase [Oricola cellulosilytica]
MPTEEKIVIRLLERRDEPDWRRLWTAYLEFYEASVSEEVFRGSFERMLAGNAGAPNEFRGLLATLAGKPVGLVHYLFHRHGWRIENVCYLQDLYADPHVRGRGIGRKLIEAVYADADREGCPSVYWLTQEFNTDARKLYDRIATLTPFIKYQR